MKEIFKNEQLAGFEIEQLQLTIHPHIDRPDKWHLTCRPIGIHGVVICPKSVTDTSEVAKAAYRQIEEQGILLSKVRIALGGEF